MLKISDLMTKDIATISPQSLVAEAVEIMKTRQIGSLLVRGTDNKPVGIFTERDLLTKIDFRNDAPLSDIRIAQIMTSSLITVTEDRTSEDVMAMMKQHGFRHMLVTRGEEVVGIVSLRDLIEAYQISLENQIKEKEAQILENMAHIRESEERFRSIFYHSADGILFADHEARIITWNPVFEQLVGFTPQELAGRSVRAFFTPDEWEKISPAEVQRQGGMDRRATCIQHKSGEAVDIDLSVSVIYGENNSVRGYIGIIHDMRELRGAQRELLESHNKLEIINKDLELNAEIFRQLAMDKKTAFEELKSYQAQMIQMEKMATLGTLAAGFAHEVKNPLGIIMQGMERIEKVFKKYNDMDSLKYLNIVRHAAIRADDVVTSLLKYSRSSQLEVAEINIFDLIEESMGLIQNKARERNVILQSDFTRMEKKMFGDGVMLQQVFFDLLTNAIDAISHDGKITVHVEFESVDGQGDDGQFIIKVQDTGAGISPQNLSKIFDPFFTTKSPGEGTGLGLSTVYLIIERHNGKISVESREGDGTTFIITLPLTGARDIKRRYEHV